MPPIASHSTATTDEAWDAATARRNLRSGEDASYYRRAFAWQDPDGDPTTLAAYRFPHHMVTGDGRIGAANTRAASAGIAVLNGGRGGANIPDGDRQGVYNHLARHLRDADREPPELASYEEALERMAVETVRLYKSYALHEIKTEEDGVFSGYASTYNRDLQGDQIVPGAFASSIRDKRGRIPILNNHDDSEVIGFSTSLAEDGKGLMLTAKLITGSQQGQNAYQLLKTAAAVDYRMGMSIGFIANDWQFDGDVRSIKEIDLWEASLTPFPAQPRAFVSAVKSTRTLEWYLRDVGRLSKSEAKRTIRAMADLNLSSGGTPDGFPPVSDRQSRWLKALIAQSPWKESDAG